jgi:hypothetical protein
MTYPPANLSPRSDASPAVPSSHAADHTAERNAINAIVAALGANPMGTHATVEARLAAIEAALSSLGYTGGSSGSGGNSGGGGSGGGTTAPTKTQTKTSTASVTYPVDVAPLAPNYFGSGNGEYLGRWFVVSLADAGLYANTLVVRTVVGGADKMLAINLDNTAETKVFDGQNMSFGPGDQYIESAGKIFNITGGGWSWDPSQQGSGWTRLNNQDDTVAGNYLRRTTSWVWMNNRAVLSLDDKTGAVSELATLPLAGLNSGDYYCHSYSLSENGCWVVMQKLDAASGDANFYKLYRYDVAANTFELRASTNASSLPLPFAAAGSYGIGTVLADGRILGAGGDGTLRSSNNVLVSATHGQLWDPATEIVAESILQSPMNGWLVAVVRTTQNGSTTWSVRAATDTKVVTLVPPTASRIRNLHWNPELEGLVLRWTEGTTLRRSAFAVLEESH